MRRRRTARRPIGYRRLLVPLAEGADSELAVDLACRFATEGSATVVAIAPIVIPLELPLEVPARVEEKRAAALVARALAVGDSYGVRVTGRAVRTRSAGDAILEQAARFNVEVIVLGFPGTDRRTTEFVLKHATSRVMLASAPVPEEERPVVRPRVTARAG